MSPNSGSWEIQSQDASRFGAGGSPLPALQMASSVHVQGHVLTWPFFGVYTWRQRDRERECILFFPEHSFWREGTTLVVPSASQPNYLPEAPPP